VQSALQQTIADLEVVIVGDGATDSARITANQLCTNPRVRFIDSPKGERHGELHRHAVLQNVTADIVCYLADDDLWLPSHVETMIALLADADFATTVPLRFEPDGRWLLPADYSLECSRAMVAETIVNLTPLSCAAHTMAFYRDLPVGWSPAPTNMPTDHHMWKKFLSSDKCRAVTGSMPTVWNFPKPFRKEWSEEQRCRELELWFSRLTNPRILAEFEEQKFTIAIRSGARQEAQAVHALRHESAHWSQRAHDLQQQNEALQQQNELLQRQAQELQTVCDAWQNSSEVLQSVCQNWERVVQDYEKSAVWRLRTAIVRMPLLATMLRPIARLTARCASSPEDN